MSTKNSEEWFTFHNTEAKENISMNMMDNNELEELKRKTSPLRIKKHAPNFNDACMSINDSIHHHNKDFNSVRNSYNFIMQTPLDRDNEVSMYSNLNYAQTQKYSQEKPSEIDQPAYLPDSHLQSSKNSHFFSDHHLHHNAKIRMLDSRMTPEDLSLSSQIPSRNPQKSHPLNSSYDDLHPPRRTTTFRKDMNQSANPLHHSQRTKTHRKQRSISMNSHHKKSSVLRAHRESETISERDLSMSLNKEMGELRDTLREVRQSSKTTDSEVRQKLARERKKNLELKKMVALLEKKVEKSEKYAKRVKIIKKEYNELLDSYEKSERIRIGQKELISTLRAEIERLAKRQAKGNMEEEKPKGKKKVKVSNKSSTRTKSKKPKKVTKN